MNNLSLVQTKRIQQAYFSEWPNITQISVNLVILIQMPQKKYILLFAHHWVSSGLEDVNS